ncbi:hypothetical protein [Nocardia sp. NPDC057455]|uniref:hypothetical protein n=1 Tax=Nocardia sp. NPDC057455 TaxID=3346138 RepID=UPI00366F699C
MTVLVWCVVAMIVVVLLGAAATAMVWDPRGRRRAAATAPIPAPTAVESAVACAADWPRTR